MYATAPNTLYIQRNTVKDAKAIIYFYHAIVPLFQKEMNTISIIFECNSMIQMKYSFKIIVIPDSEECIFFLNSTL